MKVKNLKSMLLLVAITVVFVGCSKDDEPTNPNSSIIGTWKGRHDYIENNIEGYSELTMIFHSNGKFEMSKYFFPDDETDEDSGTYKINGNKITLTFYDGDKYDDGDIEECFFEIGKDSKGDYLIVYYEGEKEDAFIKYKVK